jgi:hypothetical protein
MDLMRPSNTGDHQHRASARHEIGKIAIALLGDVQYNTNYKHRPAVDLVGAMNEANNASIQLRMFSYFYFKYFVHK